MTDGIQNTLAQLEGTKLFIRAMNLTIGFPNDPSQDVKVPFTAKNSTGSDISGFDVDFHVEKSLKKDEPSTCSIRVFNLADTTRESFSRGAKLTVRLEAGYVGGLTQLYFAEARSAWTTREGADYITHIESTDTVARPTGLKTSRKPKPGSATGNIVRTLGPKVPLDQAFNAIVAALGIKKGNLEQALAGLHGTPVASVPGGALVGNAAQRMTDLCRSAGLEWSIQDGNLQLLNIGQILSDGKRAIEIKSSTGMVGSPLVDSSGALSCKTLLIPGIAPGVLVSMNSLFVKGGYRVEKCRYMGSTYSQDWYCEFDAVKY